MDGGRRQRPFRALPFPTAALGKPYLPGPFQGTLTSPRPLGRRLLGRRRSPMGHGESRKRSVSKMRPSQRAAEKSWAVAGNNEFVTRYALKTLS